jgi:hypothetical protein
VAKIETDLVQLCLAAREIEKREIVKREIVKKLSRNFILFGSIEIQKKDE